MLPIVDAMQVWGGAHGQAFQDESQALAEAAEMQR